MECCWKEKDSTETSCDRKRRFSGSHSRHPLSRPDQPPPFDVPLFRSFRFADSSRVPLLVSLAAQLADYTPAYITTALRQFDSSIRERERERDCEASSGFVLRLHFPPPPPFPSPSFSVTLDCPVLCNNSTKLVHLHSTVAAPLGISRCSFVMHREKFSLLNATRDRKRERRKEGGGKERGRERKRYNGVK